MDKSELRVPKVCAQNREVIIIEGGGVVLPCDLVSDFTYCLFKLLGCHTFQLLILQQQKKRVHINP